MSSSLDRLKVLTKRLDNALIEKEKSNHIQTIELDIDNLTIPTVTTKNVDIECDTIRDDNIERVKELYTKLNIFEKSPDFDKIFIYKAMNLSGIGLKEEDFAQVREGKYIQVIAITYEPDKNGKKKAKNISLGYFGKAETLEKTLKSEIIEFVLRWRYEKAFQNVEHYKDLIERV